MKKVIAIVFILLTAAMITGCLPTTEASLQVSAKANFETLQEVEDTCRTMMALYEIDKQTYEQYKDSDNIDKQEQAEQAKTKANDTADAYNDYIVVNRFVWEDAVPTDIQSELPYLD